MLTSLIYNYQFQLFFNKLWTLLFFDYWIIFIDRTLTRWTWPFRIPRKVNTQFVNVSAPSRVAIFEIVCQQPFNTWFFKSVEPLCRQYNNWWTGPFWTPCKMHLQICKCRELSSIIVFWHRFHKHSKMRVCLWFFNNVVGKTILGEHDL